MSSPTSRTPRILCISFSPIHADSRVLRQLEVLRQLGDVTTVGYGSTPEGVARHIEIPADAPSLPQTPLGVLRLALRHHKAVELTAPGEKAVRGETIASGPYDLVVANDARALPLAFAAAAGAPVYADMHEWAPEEMATILVWRLLVGPYMHHLCRTYLPRTAAVTTVSDGLASLYRERYGVETGVIRNAPDFQELSPSPLDGDRVRLVHSGIADAERNLQALIEAVGILGERFSLDLYLVEVPGGHLATIRALTESSDRVTLHPPMAPDTLPRVLNHYDVGVFLYPIKHLSHLHHLPNKFFDFIQARIGIVFGPAPETDRYIREYGLGVVSPDVTAQALAETLQSLTAAQIEGFKAASHAAARELSSQTDKAAQRTLLAALLADPQ